MAKKPRLMITPPDRRRLAAMHRRGLRLWDALMEKRDRPRKKEPVAKKRCPKCGHLLDD